MGSVPIEPINEHGKFEVRSFTRYWDNRGNRIKLCSPWIRPLTRCKIEYARLRLGIVVYGSNPFQCNQTQWTV